jgi:hypothetical protein
MGDVVDLFTGQTIPAAEGSDFVQEFIDGPLGDFLFALQGLHESTDEATFRDYLAELKALTQGWPV